MYAVDKEEGQIQAKMSLTFVVKTREMSLLSEINPFLSSLWIYILGFNHFLLLYVFVHTSEGCNDYHCIQRTISPLLCRLHLKLSSSETYRQREILIRHGARLDALHCIAFGLPPANKSSLQSCKTSLYPPLTPPTTSSYPPLLSSGLGNKRLWDSFCNNVTSHPAWTQRSYRSGPRTTSQVF